MLDTYAPLIANGAGIVGVLTWLVWMLGTGRLCTGRELRESHAENKALRSSLEVRDAQLQRVLDEYLPAANSVMKALHNAAGEMTDP